MAHNHDGHDHDHHHAGHSHAGMSPSEQAQHELQCCSHHEIEIERYMRLYLLGGVLVLVTTICNLFGLGDNQVAQLPAMIGAVMLGLPLFIAAGREVVSARLSSSSLAALAIVAALVTGEALPY